MGGTILTPASPLPLGHRGHVLPCAAGGRSACSSAQPLPDIVAGWPEGVALVVGLKGLGRYGELRGATEGTAERFLFASFISLLFASTVAEAARTVIEAT